MNCLRCGRETENEQVFCFLCESVMVKYPVKPNTVVTIPDRPAPTQPAARKSARQEEDTAPLRRTIAAQVEDPAAELLLSGQLRSGQRLVLGLEENGLKLMPLS